MTFSLSNSLSSASRWKLLVLLLISSTCTPVPSFSQTLIPYLDHGVYGYSDLAGKMVIKPQFDEVTWFDSTGMADVRYGSHWSKINHNGDVLIPFESPVPIRFTPVYGMEYSQPSAYNPPEDTFPDLRIVAVDSIHFRIFNIQNEHFSELYTPAYTPSAENRFHVVFYNFIFFGKGKDSLYHVVDTNLAILLKSRFAPTILNSHLIAAKDKDGALLFDFHSLKKTLLPFSEIHQLLKDSLLIVSDTSISFNQFNRRSQTLKGLADLDGRIVVEIKHPELHYKMGDLLLEYIWGKGTRFIDLKGQPIDTITYPGMNYQCDSFYMATTHQHKSLVLNKQGKPLSKSYDLLQQGIYTCKYFHFKDGLFAGLLDSTFKEIIRVEADEVSYTNQPGIYSIKKNKKYGLVRKDGALIAPAIYTSCHFIFPEYIEININGKEGLLKSDGTVLLQPIYDDVSSMYDNSIKESFIYTEQNGFYTLYDLQFRIVEDSLAKHSFSRKVNISRSDGFTFLKDPHGKLITEPAEKYRGAVVYTITDTSWIHILTRGDHLEIINDQAEIITNDSILLGNDVNKRNYEAGLFAVKVGDKQGVINHRGKWILPLGTEDILAVTPGLIVTKKKGHYKHYDAKGHLLASDLYHVLDIDKGERYWRVELDNKYGYINSLTGALVVPIVYDQTTKFDDFLAVAINGKTNGSKNSFLVDTTGKVILKTTYDSLYALDEIESYKHYMAVAKGKIGIIQINGRVVIPIEYDNLVPFADSMFFATHTDNEGWKLINRSNRVVFTGQHFPDKHYIRLPDNYFLFTKNGLSVIVDPEGTVVKSLPGTSFSKIPATGDQPELLEGIDNENRFFINAHTLVEYRRS